MIELMMLKFHTQKIIESFVLVPSNNQHNFQCRWTETSFNIMKWKNEHESINIKQPIVLNVLNCNGVLLSRYALVSYLCLCSQAKHKMSWTACDWSGIFTSQTFTIQSFCFDTRKSSTDKFLTKWAICRSAICPCRIRQSCIIYVNATVTKSWALEIQSKGEWESAAAAATP